MNTWEQNPEDKKANRFHNKELNVSVKLPKSEGVEDINEQVEDLVKGLLLPDNHVESKEATKDVKKQQSDISVFIAEQVQKRKQHKQEMLNDKSGELLRQALNRPRQRNIT